MQVKHTEKFVSLADTVFMSDCRNLDFGVWQNKVRHIKSLHFHFTMESGGGAFMSEESWLKETKM